MSAAPDAKWWPLVFSDTWASETPYLPMQDKLICWVNRADALHSPRNGMYRIYYYWQLNVTLHTAAIVDCDSLVDVRATLLAISELTFGSTL
jgi:hypothetical protein